MKRILALFLTILMLLSITGTAALAEEVTFEFAAPFKITQWDPQNENKTMAYSLSKLTYNTLATLTAEFKIEPELATEWKSSEDGLTWTFKLREGVKFHNGEDFNADSVAATMQRMIDNPTLVQAAFWSVLKGVEKVSDYEVKLILTQPWGAIITQLCDTPMLPAKALKEKGDALFVFDDNNKPIGTGPWKCDKWLAGSGDAEFVRNDEYWGWGDKKSNIDRIIYRAVIEDTSRVNGILAGDLDMIDSVPVEQVKMLSEAGGITVQDILGTNIVHLGFRTKPLTDEYRVFGDVNARKAVQHALDRQGIVEFIAGGGKPASWPCPDTVLGYDAEKAAVPEYSVELAKEYLAKTDYKGQTIRFIVPTGVFARSKEVAQAIEANLTDAGFTVNMEIMENATFQTERASGNYDLYLQRYPFPAGDPDSVVTQRWLNDAHKSGYVNEELNAKILAAKGESDPAKREQLLKEMFAIQWDVLAPHMAVYQQVTTVAYKSTVTGLKVRPDNVFDYSLISYAN